MHWAHLVWCSLNWFVVWPFANACGIQYWAIDTRGDSRVWFHKKGECASEDIYHFIGVELSIDRITVLFTWCILYQRDHRQKTCTLQVNETVSTSQHATACDSINYAQHSSWCLVVACGQDLHRSFVQCVCEYPYARMHHFAITSDHCLLLLMTTHMHLKYTLQSLYFQDIGAACSDAKNNSRWSWLPLICIHITYINIHTVVIARFFATA
jgi:hypothetical protein